MLGKLGQWLFRGGRRWRNLLLTAGALLILLTGLMVLLPRQYPVPEFTPSQEIAYWDLPSGSRIGYFHLPTTTDTEKAPIIYLHGGPGGMISPELLELLRPLTREGYPVYLYDQVGSGHSSRLEDIAGYSVARHREDLREIVEQIGAKKVILFAHSWGTMLATDFYSTYPERVEKLIYSGPGPILPVNRAMLTEDPPDALNIVQPQHSNREANQRVNNLRTKAIRYWAYITGGKLASDKEVDAFYAYLNGHLRRATTCQGDEDIQYQAGLGYYSHLMTVKSFGSVSNKRAVIKENPIPLLIIRGQCDNQAWGYTKEYLGLFPTAQLHIMEATGHALQLSKQTEYLRVIIPFLQSESNG